MFKVTPTKDILISQEEDHKFSLFLNRGSMMVPIRYIFQSSKGCEVYLLVFKQNSKVALITKTFKDNGTIITTYDNGQTSTSSGNVVISTDGDMILRFDAADTTYIGEGKYFYQIRAKLLDPEDTTDQTFVQKVCTNRKNLIVIDDDFDREW